VTVTNVPGPFGQVVWAGLQPSKNCVVQAVGADVVRAGAALTADKAMERARNLETILMDVG